MLSTTKQAQTAVKEFSRPVVTMSNLQEAAQSS